MIGEGLFYMFSGIGIGSGVMVIRTENPVHSVLYLVIVFCNATGILLLMGVELLGMLLLIVYVGAIAVLFLFVVMMLVPRSGKVTVSGGGGGGMVLRYVVVMIGAGLGMYIRRGVTEVEKYGSEVKESRSWMGVVDSMSNIEEMGEVVYMRYYEELIIAGFVLLVAMIGAIVLAKGRKKGVEEKEVW